MQESYLAHFGVKGMKWGVRRYRNSDGSLTESGRARYTKNGKKKNPTKMSSKDLERSTKRLHAENQYRRELREEKTSKTSYKVGQTILRAGAAYVGTQATMRLLNQISGGSAFGNPVARQKISAGAALCAGFSAWDIKLSTIFK